MYKRCLFYIIAVLFICLSMTGSAAELTCSVCGQTEAEMTVVSVDESGHHFKCACGDAYTLPHRWGEWTGYGVSKHKRTCEYGCTEEGDCSGGTATCTEPAVCTVCSGTYGAVDLTNHSWDDGVVTVEPDCTNAGVKVFTCANDPKHTREETVPVKEDAHAWDDGVVTVEPTCTNAGVKVFTCANDPKHTREEAVPVNADAHKWDEGVETRASTCRTEGVKTFTCQINDQHTYTQALPIDPDAHFFRDSKVLKAATCTQEGIVSYTCLYSASHVVKETIPVDPDAHHWDSGTVITKSDCVTAGETLYTCLDNPSHTRTDTTPPDLTTHVWEERIVTMEPTCTRSGKITLICARDPNHTGTESIPPLGHSWTISAVTKEPTCEETGVMTYTCANDSNHTRTETIPALGHMWGNMVLVAEPTCTQEGEKSYICGNDIDHKTTVRIAIDPNAHSYEATDATVVLHGICVDGEARVLRCTECGHEDYEMISAPLSHEFVSWHTVDDEIHTAVCSLCGEFTAQLPCLETRDVSCPICLDEHTALHSIYGVAAKDANGKDDYVIGTAAGSGLMHLMVYLQQEDAFIPADFRTPIAISLNESQIAAALQPGRDQLANRAIAILQSDDSRILRNDDLVMICNDDDAVLLHVFASTDGNESDELFCRIDNGVITFSLRERHMLDDQLAIWLVLEER